MEYLDILDAHGNPTGQRKLRSEVHRDGDWHGVAMVWLMNARGEVLIQQRSMSKDVAPGKWDASAAGHIAAGEDPLEAAVKETEEELSLKVQPNDLEWVLRLRLTDETSKPGIRNNQFNECYILQRDMPVHEIKFQKEEVETLEYVSPQTLKEGVESGAIPFVFPYAQFELFFTYLIKRFT